MKRLDRRQFLGTSAAAAVALGSPRSLVSGARSGSALDRLNIASIGVHNRAAGNLKGVASENIVAICDIDQEFLDAAGETYPNARRYRDYRVMLEKEAEKIDAVLVSTPDHTHAPAASMALQMKKHVYCEKPLTHTIYEARRLAELAAENNLVTQMGTQIHAEENYRLVVELVQSGAIGEIREVHVWVNVDYSGRRMITGNRARATSTGICGWVPRRPGPTVRASPGTVRSPWFTPSTGAGSGTTERAPWGTSPATGWTFPTGLWISSIRPGWRPPVPRRSWRVRHPAWS